MGRSARIRWPSRPSRPSRIFDGHADPIHANLTFWAVGVHLALALVALAFDADTRRPVPEGGPTIT